MPSPTTPLLSGHFYHVYNRGNNGIPLFYQQRNYPYFLKLYSFHISKIADTYAYCLMNNHFHLLIRIHDHFEVHDPVWYVSNQFRTFFATYTKAINRAVGRTGSLFEKPFRRKLVDKQAYFDCLVAYIHRNPQHHQFVDDFREWRWSSYGAMVSNRPTQVKRSEVLAWFGGRESFIDAHDRDVDESVIEPLIGDDFV